LVADERLRGLDRVRTLWRLFRNERDDPEPFYSLLATEAVRDLEGRHGPLVGQRILDLGCGPGWYARALRARGAVVTPLDGDPDELLAAGRGPAGAILGDAARLPIGSGVADGVFCSNLLEHAADTRGVLTEIARVLRPGAWAYVSWTNWYSPWGGHDMTPWHLLGPERGSRAYERRHGPPPKNRYGTGLFPVHIGPTLRLVGELSDLELERAEPRYWPWARAVVSVPGLREVLTWNCVLRLRRRG
jgi:SAM-dependent methyltransferase